MWLIIFCWIISIFIMSVFKEAFKNGLRGEDGWIPLVIVIVYFTSLTLHTIAFLVSLV